MQASLRKALAVAAAAFGVVFFTQAFLVKVYGVNVPYWDEWESVDLFHKVQLGTASASDLFAFHAEHRILTERVVTLVLLRLMGEWSPIGGMLVSALVAATTASLWAFTLARLGVRRWTIAVSTVVLLSPVQWENILWGFQVQFYTLMLGVTAALCAVAGASQLSWPVVAVATAGCSMATLSVASGLLSWGAVGGALLARTLLDGGESRKRGLTRVAVFGAIAAAHAYLYLRGMPQVTGHEPLHAHSATQFIDWLVDALAFPVVDPGGGMVEGVAGADPHLDTDRRPVDIFVPETRRNRAAAATGARGGHRPLRSARRGHDGVRPRRGPRGGLALYDGARVE
jgi:hypothetical protein